MALAAADRGFTIIFWQFMPKPETAVHYRPWFLDQVERDNIRWLVIQGIEIRGELRRPQPCRTGARNPVVVGRFITYVPSDEAVESLIGASAVMTDRGRRS